MIYFDNAATTKMSETALNAFVEISSEFFGNPSSVYHYGKAARKYLDEARKIVADAIGAESEEIYFTSGGTESDNWAISQAEEGFDNIITSTVEHHAVLNAVSRLEKKGCKALYIPVDSGCIVRNCYNYGSVTSTTTSTSR